MIFTSPAWLGLLGLVPVIIALHFRRKRPLDVGSLHVWLRAGDNVRSRATRRAPLEVSASLLLQVLAVVLLALALADPRPHDAIAGPLHEVHLVDASVLMALRDVPPSRFDAAIDDLVRHLRSLPPHLEASVVLVRERPYVLSTRRAVRTSVHEALQSTDVAHVDADWHAGARTAQSLVQDDARAHVQIWTAPESAGLATEVVEAASPGTTVGVSLFGTRDPPNAGLRDVVARLRDPSVPGRWIVEGTVVARGLEGETIPIAAHFQPEGTAQALSWATAETVVDRSGASQFAIPLDVPDDGLLELRLPDGADAYGGDDRIVRRLQAQDAIRVLRIGPEDADVIDHALASLPGVEFYWSDRVPDDVTTFDLVVLDGTESEAPPSTSVLWLGSGPARGTGAPINDPDVRVAMPEHPYFGDYSTIDLTIDQAYPAHRLAGSDVLLVDDGTGAPLVQARTTDVGVQVAVAFDPRDSTWPGRLGFPAFLAAVVDAATPDRSVTDGEALACVVGTPCALPEGAFAPDWTISAPDGSHSIRPRGFVPLANDDLAGGVWPSSTAELQFVPTAPGRYFLTMESKGGTGQFLPVDAVPQVVEHAGDAFGQEGRVPAVRPSVGRSISRWLILFASLVVAVEAIRSARSPRGFAHPTTWTTVRGRRRASVIAFVTLIAIASGIAAWFGVVGPGLTRIATRGNVIIGESGPRQSGDPTVGVVPFDASRPAPAPGRVTRGGNDPRYLTDSLGDAVQLVVGGFAEPSRSTVRLMADHDVRLSASDYLELARVSQGTHVEVDIAQSAPSQEAAPAPIVTWEFGEPIRAGDTVRMSVESEVPGGQDALLRATWDGRSGVGNGVPSGRTRSELVVPAPDTPGTYALGLELLGGTSGSTLDTVETIVEVVPAPRLLILSDHVEASQALAERLTLQGLEVDTRPPRRTPSSLPALSAYDVVLLLDVSATSLHTAYQGLLEEWVRTRAGGLVITGGEQSFGAGGYFRTTLDAMSPLSARIPDERPEATLVFVLDRSGSMDARVGPVTRLDIAKEATTSSLDLLADESLVGVIAFDTEASIASDVLPLREREAIEAAVEAIGAGGGTSLYPALVKARDLIENSDSMTKHIIVLTDGLSQPGDFASALQDLRSLGVTTSFVGISDGADRGQLANLAEMGGGAYHLTLDFRALPGILAQETLTLGGDPIERGAVFPSWVPPAADFATGMDGDPPPLDGYVRTTAKPEATVHLARSSEGSPLLASWRYGLGRVVAFSSQAIGPWSAAWTSDPDMAKVWPQLVRWTAGDVRKAALQVRTTQDTDYVDIDVTAMNADGVPVSDLRLFVRSLDPVTSEVVRSRTLREHGVGRYAASLFVGPSERTILLEVVANAEEAPAWIGPITRTLLHPVDPALDNEAPSGEPTLRTLASVLAASDVMEERRGGWFPWRIGWASGTTAWAVVLLTAFVASLLLRYEPTFVRPLLHRKAHG